MADFHGSAGYTIKYVSIPSAPAEIYSHQFPFFAGIVLVFLARPSSVPFLMLKELLLNIVMTLLTVSALQGG